jgi:hypothetical protein
MRSLLLFIAMISACARPGVVHIVEVKPPIAAADAWSRAVSATSKRYEIGFASATNRTVATRPLHVDDSTIGTFVVSLLPPRCLLGTRHSYCAHWRRVAVAVTPVLHKQGRLVAEDEIPDRIRLLAGELASAIEDAERP